MSKIEKTLSQIIKLFSNQNEVKIAVAGGVGLDGFFHFLTRKHDDIDIDAYGNLPRNKGLEIVKKLLSAYKPKFNGIYFEAIINGVKIEIGYVRIISEKYNEFSYDAGDGKFTISNPLFLIGKGTLANLNFTVCNPAYALAEKIMLPILKKKPYRKKDLDDINYAIAKIDTKKIQSALFERYKFKNGEFKDIGMP